MSKAKLRTCFIAVPNLSNWGLPKAKRGTWLTAHDNRKSAEEIAAHFEKYGHPHDVVMFREVPAPKPRRNTK